MWRTCAGSSTARRLSGTARETPGTAHMIESQRASYHKPLPLNVLDLSQPAQVCQRCAGGLKRMRGRAQALRGKPASGDGRRCAQMTTAKCWRPLPLSNPSHIPYNPSPSSFKTLSTTAGDDSTMVASRAECLPGHRSLRRPSYLGSYRQSAGRHRTVPAAGLGTLPQLPDLQSRRLGTGAETWRRGSREKGTSVHDRLSASHEASATGP